MAAVLRVARSVRLRLGELLGLTWARVYLGDDPHLYIAEQVYKGKRKRLKDGRLGARHSVVSQDGAGADGLEGRDRLRGPRCPVFASAVGTPLGYSNVYNRVLQPALKAAGLDSKGIAFHAFRKACGSVRLLRAGK